MSESIPESNSDENGHVEIRETLSAGEDASSPQIPKILADIIPPKYLQGDYPEKFLFYAKSAGVLFTAIFLYDPILILYNLWLLLRTILGIGLGLGLGVGLALHVFQQLQKWQVDYDKKRQRRKKMEAQSRNLKQLEESIATSGRQSRQKASLLNKGLLSEKNNAQDASSVNHRDSTFFSSASSIGDAVAFGAEDGDSYIGLMAQAGYLVHDRVLRGQVLRKDHDFWNVLYRFTDDKIPFQRGVRLVAEDWPALPQPVTRELGRFIEHVMRDFVSSWYSTMDRGVVFRVEQEKRDEGILRDGGEDSDDDDEHSTNSDASNGPPETQQQRRMVFSTLTHRRAPMVDCCYKMMSSAFGNLATRAEHVNIFELVLLKWTQVLGQTLSEYRSLRKIAQDKRMQQYNLQSPKKEGTSSTKASSVRSHQPSEVEVTREFLLKGKLHRAITFGLDVPSFLFADASGEECGLGIDGEDESAGTPRDPTAVLEYRLYHTTILQECMVDYNRILANRLVRALLPKSETTSQCVLQMVTEIMGGAVLTPVMNLFMPSFLNDLIVKSLSNTGTQQEAPPSDSPRKRSSSRVEEGEKTQINKDSNRPRTATDSTHSGPESDGAAEHNDSNDKPVKSANIDQDSEDSASNIGDHKKNDETIGFKILKLSEMAMKDLNKHIHLERYKHSTAIDEETAVNWDDAECQHSILKLVMVIEAALLHGRCAHNEKQKEMFPDLLLGTNSNVETATESSGDSIAQKKTITDILMELASDMDAFERKVESLVPQEESTVSTSVNGFEPDVNEVAMLRTLICTWLHSGQLFRAVGLICKGADTIFKPYYAESSFLLMLDERREFIKQIKKLDGIEIMVETMAIRVSERLDVSEEFELLVPPVLEVKTERDSSSKQAKDTIPPAETTPKVSDPSLYYGHQSTPRYLDFQRNEAFAASLRAERKRRWRVWETRKMDEGLYSMIRKTASSREYELHSEMHKLSRLFFNGTTVMTIRDAARKREKAYESLDEKVSLLTLEIASSKRRIEVPDDDSSFLLRAQSRQLNPVSVHLDDRNHDMSYKCFLATYEEPAVSQGSSRYGDGRYIRRCFLQYYPSDRTARIVLQNDARKLDKRKGIGAGKMSGGHMNDGHSNSHFSRSFLKQRYLCQKVAASQSFMSSSLMESSDFNSFPRTGKALDFIYRMSLFEHPAVDLAGEKFKIQDSSNRGIHRADASSLEVSDASLSYVLLKCGKDFGVAKKETQKDGKTRTAFRNVETGRDGYPVLFLRFSKSGDQGGTEFKPYRLSFVRAALMLTSSRQEAQFDSLAECVRAGSAKSATKARTEERLRPVRKMLYFASGRSEQGANHDLKLGQFLDRGQLQRNGLLNLRHPSSILQLKAKVEGTALAKEASSASIASKSYIPDTVLYRIRCTAIVELVDNGVSTSDLEPYALDDGSHARFYREEFVVHRSMKEFQFLHKQLKSQVALTESTMSTGNKIVGALSNHSLNRRNKKILIPSLAQASNIGVMGMTQKTITKRKELLDEYIGYLLASNSLMNRCSELLLFLGASYPFPPQVTMTKAQGNIMDLLGRTDFIRSVAVNDIMGNKLLKLKHSTDALPRRVRRSSVEKAKESTSEPAEAIAMDPGILNKVDQIPLAEVRNRILELIRLSFSFENASLVRTQMLSALETASFLALAKQSDFRRVLHDLHANHLSGDAIGGLIEKILNILWPDGVFMKAAPLLTPEEERILRDKAKMKLHERFPDQVRKLLGKEMTKEGLDMIHEMLQNKVIVKSLFYMLLDLLWIEVFPELRDTLPCASALDLDLL